VPSAAGKERPSSEQGLQQEPSNKLLSAKVTDKTEAHLPNGHAQGDPATEKVNGSAFNDKAKKSRGEPPFTKQEREEMEALLGDLCGHLGQLSWIQLFPQALTNTYQSFIQLDFWKGKMLQIIFCSTLIGYYRYLYMTRHHHHPVSKAFDYLFATHLLLHIRFMDILPNTRNL
jgi:hypothetical protein